MSPAARRGPRSRHPGAPTCLSASSKPLAPASTRSPNSRLRPRNPPTRPRRRSRCPRPRPSCSHCGPTPGLPFTRFAYAFIPPGLPIRHPASVPTVLVHRNSYTLPLLPRPRPLLQQVETARGRRRCWTSYRVGGCVSSRVAVWAAGWKYALSRRCGAAVAGCGVRRAPRRDRKQQGTQQRIPDESSERAA